MNTSKELILGLVKAAEASVFAKEVVDGAVGATRDIQTTPTSTTKVLHMSRAMRMVAQANINNQGAGIRRVNSCDRSPLISPAREL